jgi:transcriptional regulator with XRE-family HTH domain
MQAGEARGKGAFATLLRQGRQTAGFTLSQLAEKAGLSLRAVQHLEGGRGLPYADTARRLADALT